MFTHRVITNVEKMAVACGKVDETKAIQRVNIFNSILEVLSAVTVDGKRVEPFQLYYEEYKRQLAESGKERMRQTSKVSFS